jgi:putative NIF3 family GTP cyclohydrolase 1 type 2
VIFPAYLKAAVLKAMRENHPYEEVAFDLVALANDHPELGSGLVGDLPANMEEKAFLELLKTRFNLQVVRHTSLLNGPVSRVALCGGAGSFLVPHALSAGAQVFIVPT